MLNSTVTKHFSTFCSLNNLKPIRDFVENQLLDNHVDDYETAMIVLAVDEVCSNSIIHSNQQNPNSLIDIFLKLNNNEVTVEIKDKGKHFDYDSYKEPKIDALIKNKDKGSMGLLLVRRVMDKTEYFHQNDVNIFRLIKKVSCVEA